MPFYIRKYLSGNTIISIDGIRNERVPESGEHKEEEDNGENKPVKQDLKLTPEIDDKKPATLSNLSGKY